MSDQTLQTLVIALLSAGGATFIWTVAKSIIAFKNSAEGREDKAIGRLEKFESDCRDQLASERIWGAYWQRRAATLEYGLRQNGIDPPPLEPEPKPKEIARP
jgi:hypothetical protein